MKIMMFICMMMVCRMGFSADVGLTRVLADRTNVNQYESPTKRSRRRSPEASLAKPIEVLKAAGPTPYDRRKRVNLLQPEVRKATIKVLFGRVQGENPLLISKMCGKKNSRDTNGGFAIEKANELVPLKQMWALGKMLQQLPDKSEEKEMFSRSSTVQLFTTLDAFQRGHRVPRTVGGENTGANIMAQSKWSNMSRTLGDKKLVAHKHAEDSAVRKCVSIEKSVYQHEITQCAVLKVADDLGPYYVVFPVAWKISVRSPNGEIHPPLPEDIEGNLEVYQFLVEGREGDNNPISAVGSVRPCIEIYSVIDPLVKSPSRVQSVRRGKESRSRKHIDKYNWNSDIMTNEMLERKIRALDHKGAKGSLF